MKQDDINLGKGVKKGNEDEYRSFGAHGCTDSSFSGVTYHRSIRLWILVHHSISTIITFSS